MTDNQTAKKPTSQSPAGASKGYQGANRKPYAGKNPAGGSSYAGKNPSSGGYAGNKSQGGGNSYNGKRESFPTETEFEQKIIDLARVTRVMAGGKRMRFRACVAIGNGKGRVGLGLAKGADVTLAITKAVNQAKKQMIDVPLAEGTIPHEIRQKYGASLILLKPGRKGQGLICGSVVRMISELAGVHNISGKILGTNNKVTNAKCVILALSSMKTKKNKTPKPVAVKEEEGETVVVKAE